MKSHDIGHMFCVVGCVCLWKQMSSEFEVLRIGVGLGVNKLSSDWTNTWLATSLQAPHQSTPCKYFVIYYRVPYCRLLSCTNL